MPTNTNDNVKFVRVNGSSDLVNLKDKTAAYINAVNAVDGVHVEAADANGDVYVKYNDKYMTKLEFAKIVRPGAIVHACDYKEESSQYYDMDNLYIDGCKITDTYNTLEPKIRASRKNGRDVGCLGKEEYNLEELRNMSLGNILDIIFFPKPKVSEYVVDWDNVKRNYWFLYHDNGASTGAPTEFGVSNRPDVDLTNLKIVEYFEDGRGFFIDEEGQSASIEGVDYTYNPDNINKIRQQRTLVNYNGPQSRNVNVENDTILGREYKIEVKVLDGDDVSEPITSETASDVFPNEEKTSLKLGVFISTRPLGSTNEDDWVSVPDDMIVNKTCDINLYKNVYDVTLASPVKTTYIERDPLVISNDCKYTVRFTDGSSVDDKLFTGTDYENGSGNGALKITKYGTNNQMWTGSSMNASGYNAFGNGWSSSDGIIRRDKGMHKTTTSNPNTLKVTASYRPKSNGGSDKADSPLVTLTVNTLSIYYVEMTKKSDKTEFTRHDNFDLDVYYSPYNQTYYGPFGVTIHYKANNNSIDDVNDGVTRTVKTDVVYYGDGANTGIGGITKNDNVDGTTKGYTYPDAYGEADTHYAFTMFSNSNYAESASMTIANIKSGYNLNGITNTLVDNDDKTSKVLKTDGEIYFKFNASEIAIRNINYQNSTRPVLYFDEISASTAQEIKVENDKNNNYKFSYRVNEHKFDRISFNNYTKTDYLIADYCDILEKTGTNGNEGSLKVYGQLDGDNPGCAAGVAQNVKQSSGASGTIADKVKDGTLGTNEIGYVLLKDSKKTNEYGVAKTGTTGNYRLNYVASNSVNASSIISAGTGQTGTTTGTNLNKFSSAGTDHARFWNTSSNWLLATSYNSYEVPATTNESAITYEFKNDSLQCVGCEFKAVDTVFVGLIPKNANVINVQIGDKIVLDSLANYSKNNVKNAVRYNTSTTNHYGTFNGNDSDCGYFQKVSSTTDMCTKTDAGHTGITFGQVGRWAANASDDTAHYILSIVVPTTVQIDEVGSTAWTGSVAIVSDQFQILREQEMTGFDSNYKYNVYTPLKTYTGLYGCQQEFHLMKK